MQQAAIAKTALFLTAAIWGGSFTIGKLAAEIFSASPILAFRFLIAAALLAAAIPGFSLADACPCGGNSPRR